MKNFIILKKIHYCILNFDLKKKLAALFLICSLFHIQANAINTTTDHEDDLQQRKTLTGIVYDELGIPLPGVNIIVKGSSVGTSTDFDGNFNFVVKSTSKVLVISYIGYKSVELTIGEKTKFSVTLQLDLEAMDEVVVVGYGTQKKASLVSSITTISPKEIKGPTSNLTSMLAGRVSGMISYQRSGEPGSDNASFFIRGLGSFGSGKQDPLILIDGIESSNTDMARLQPDDIQSFSVLKDASAASIYGARGANGVVLITTKSGINGKLQVTFRAESRVSSNTRNFEFADNITYMNLANEAALTRDPVANLPYSRIKIDRTASGEDEYLYPSNNWIDQLIKDYTVNSGYNLSLKGGSDKIRYYVAGTYNIDNGVLKVDGLNDFNNNIKLKNYSVRSNINIDLTPTTEGIIRMYGQFDDYSGPLGGYNSDNKWVSGGTNIFNKAVWSNPVAFPAVYPASYLPYVNHPLFGSAVASIGSTTLLTNPYAEMVKGYEVYKASTIQVQFELKQNLEAITEGLSARAMTYIRRYSYYRTARQYVPFYYSSRLDPVTNKTVLSALNDGGKNSIVGNAVGREYLDYNEGDKDLSSKVHLETAINYNRTFNEKHNVSGMLISILSNFETGNSGSLQASLPSKNHGISGRFTYGYDDRYLVEANFGYNGSERFSSDKRYGFFPSFGLGYIVSNEHFFEPLTNVIDNLKFRASFGWVGNDQIGEKEDRFFYLSEVSLNNGLYGTTFGSEFDYYTQGLSISRYANANITWEKSKQINLGMDLKLFNALDVTVDVFKQHRYNILEPRSNIGSTLGLSVTPVTNFGEASSEGLDLSLSYNKQFSNDLWANVRGNFTYSKSEILKTDENEYPEELAHLSRKGHSIKQAFGYIAERLFIDDEEAANSPKQFGEYGGGDIKYRDVNNDGVITSQDLVPIGYPTVPELIFGFGGTLGYKNFDFSMFIQGSARSSFFINSRNISPFVTNGGAQNGLLKVIADNHWSEDNRNSYALWPRLSDTFIINNNVNSTWWMRNGAFLRLKSVEVGYNAPDKFISKFGLSSLRIYASGRNLGVISKFKLWDPEMGGNGLGYPIQAVYNLGVLLNL